MSEFSVTFWDASVDVRRQKLQAYLLHHGLTDEEMEALLVPFSAEVMSEAKFSRCVNGLLTALATDIVRKTAATKK